jgi:hypothetical protein
MPGIGIIGGTFGGGSSTPDPNRNPFTGNYGAGVGAFDPGYQADDYGCFSNLYRWTTEPATSQNCSVEYFCGSIIGSQILVGFFESTDNFTPFQDNIQTGFYANSNSSGQFFVGGTYVGQFYVPINTNAILKVSWNATDGKFRFYIDGVLTYTSTYTKFGSVFPALASSYGNRPIAGCFVTRLD